MSCINPNSPEFKAALEKTGGDPLAAEIQLLSKQSFKIFTEDEYNRNPSKYSEEVERVVRLIENKLKLKEKSFNGKATSEYIDKKDYLDDVFKKLLSNIGLPETIKNLQELQTALNDNSIIEYIQEQYDTVKRESELAKKNLDDVNSSIRVLKGYLNNPMLNNYDLEQQEIIKKAFPALFGELGNYKSTKQALNHYKQIINTPKFLNRVLNLDYVKTQYFGLQSKLNKFENLLNYNTLSSEDFKYRIYKVIENELNRRGEFFDSPKMQEVVLAEKENIAKRNYENSVKGILERLASNENTVSGKIAKMFLKHPKTLNAIKSENINRSFFGFAGGEWKGDGTLDVNYNDEKSLRHILLHELTHHFTVPYVLTYLKKYSSASKYEGFIERYPTEEDLKQEIDYSFDSLSKEEIENISKLEDIYIHVLKLHKEGKITFENNFTSNPEYGLENFYEFLSEVISNPYFASEIAKQPSLYNKKSNLLKDILNAIFDMFGIKNVSLLDDVYSLFEESFLNKDDKYEFNKSSSENNLSYKYENKIKPGVEELFDSNFLIFVEAKNAEEVITKLINNNVIEKKCS